MERQEKQIHEAIRDDQRLFQRLKRLNNGYNFFNIDPEKRPYKIELVVQVELTLQGADESLSVFHNLPFYKYSYGTEEEQKWEGFLEALSKWVSKPLWAPRSFDRGDEQELYHLKEQIHCRRVSLQMSDVAVVVHEVAKEYLKRKYGIDSFEKLVAEHLGRQRDATRDELKAIDRWVCLEERKVFLDKAVEGRRHGYSYERTEDKTARFSMSVADYNAEMKGIEKEMRKLAKRHEFLNIEEARFHYIDEPDEADAEEDLDEGDYDEDDEE